MKMKKLPILAALVISTSLIFTGCGSASQETAETPAAEEQAPAEQAPAERTFNYYTAEQTKQAIENKEDILLIDIQVEDEWNQHHIQGAIPTYAYPVETDEQKAKLEEVSSQLEGEQPIVIVCPGGKGGAQRTVAYFESKGIAPERLFILENGQKGWPYDELLEK